MRRLATASTKDAKVNRLIDDRAYSKNSTVICLPSRRKFSFGQVNTTILSKIGSRDTAIAHISKMVFHLIVRAITKYKNEISISFLQANKVLCFQIFVYYHLYLSTQPLRTFLLKVFLGSVLFSCNFFLLFCPMEHEPVQTDFELKPRIVSFEAIRHSIYSVLPQHVSLD